MAPLNPCKQTLGKSNARWKQTQALPIPKDNNHLVKMYLILRACYYFAILQAIFHVERGGKKTHLLLDSQCFFF